MKQRYLWMVRRAYRAMRHPRLRHRPWWRKLTRPLMHKSLWKPCRDSVAKGMAIGLFIGLISPFIPQSLCAGVIAAWLRANVPFAIVSTWLSNPFTYPFILPAQLWLGRWLQSNIGLRVPGIDDADQIAGLGGAAIDLMLGAAVSGILMGMLAFPLVHLFSAILPHHLPHLPHLHRQKQATTPARDGGKSSS
ncbi:DUF2062 domain-containing protein [Luteolibacter marinus]|uniref:DUF2062 domain-containing protein n=1 Tax=Luteolibacter marinus TaxID=2776705 RepID=UPI0018684B75|nr:DUF2062 domain-containing protein [Luteolibacter marinus]